MRTGTILLARVSLMGVIASVLVSCAPAVIDRTLFEQPVFVRIPVGTATPAQKATYENHPVAVERFERRCTSKPAPKTECPSWVWLKISVIEGARAVNVGGHGGRAQLLALIENTGTTPTFDGILPGEQALVAVDKRGLGGQPRETALRLIHFKRNLIPPNFTVTDGEYGIVIPCYTHRGRSSDMSFRGCIKGSIVHHNNPQTEVRATSLLTLEAKDPFGKATDGKPEWDPADFASLDDPLWLRCAPGCCTS